MKTKTSELTGAALDWAVAKALGQRTYLAHYEHTMTGICVLDADLVDMQTDGQQELRYSRDREQGGPIIEREEIGTQPVYRDGELVGWMADSKKLNPEEGMEQYGPTPLTAGLRCYVASKLGDEVDVPAELLN